MLPDSSDCISGQRIEAETLRTRTQLEKLWAKLDAEHDKIVKMESWQEYHAKSMEQVVNSIELISRKLDTLHDDVTKGKAGVSLGGWVTEKWIALCAVFVALGSWLHK